MRSISDRRPRRVSIRRRALAAPTAIMAGLLALTACASTEETALLEGITRPEPLQVGSITVPEVDADGRSGTFAFRAPAGGLLFVYFGYTNCPDLCPTTFADLRGALDQLGEDASRVDTAFVTVDPTRDTPEVMTGFLASFVAGGHALRVVDPDRLSAVERAFGASSTVRTNDDGTVEVSHSSISYVVDPAGAVVVEWPFGVSSDAMANDLRILLDQLPQEPT
jgi:protein SCO1